MELLRKISKETFTKSILERGEQRAESYRSSPIEL
jgi:hypothetical protein